MNGEHKVGGAARPLLKESDLADLLGVSERKLKSLRAAGLVPDPIELGPRCARWTHEDFAETLARLPRREVKPEPETLAAGRRRRVEKLKAAAPAAR